MELTGFDPHREQDDSMRMRSNLSAAAKAQRGTARSRRRKRMLVSGTVAAIATIILVGFATWQGARVQRFLTELQQRAAEYASLPSQSARITKAIPAQEKAQPGKTRGHRKATSPAPRTIRAAAPSSGSQFVEVVDPTNRHYLVRFHPAPVLPLPGERSHAAPDVPAAIPLTPTVTQTVGPPQPQMASLSLREQAPGSAGIVVLRGLVDRDGRIGNLEVVSGPPELAVAAAAAARRWQYVPEYYNGQPTERLVQITVDFTVLLNR